MRSRRNIGPPWRSDPPGVPPPDPRSIFRQKVMKGVLCLDALVNDDLVGAHEAKDVPGAFI